MQISYDAWQNYLYWQKIDKKMLKRINELIKAIIREPFSGIGKAEALQFDMKGCWSRTSFSLSNHRHVYHNFTVPVSLLISLFKN